MAPWPVMFISSREVFFCKKKMKKGERKTHLLKTYEYFPNIVPWNDRNAYVPLNLTGIYNLEQVQRKPQFGISVL